jgi:hypothetical protein
MEIRETVSLSAESRANPSMLSLASLAVPGCSILLLPKDDTTGLVIGDVTLDAEVKSILRDVKSI